jgi:long-chain acyl-CoA synthetase
MGDRLMHTGLERAAVRFGSRAAILFGDSQISFADLETRTDAFAGRLASRGVGPGDRVAVMMSNGPEFVVSVLAISKLGAASVLLNPAWKSLEVAHVFDLVAPSHAVCDSSTEAVLGEWLQGRELSNVDAQESEVSGGRDSERIGAPGQPDKEIDALLVFSSGTTGLPKAARHTHASITAAVDDWRICLGLGPDDRFQVATPPSHILGLLNLLTAIDAGATVRLHRRFELDEVLERIANERMTLEMAVAPIALAMANHPQLERYDLSSLRYIMWGATPVTASVAEIVTRRTGVRWLPAYGATELPVISANPVADPAAWRLDSAGLPAPGTRIRVVDLDSGEVLSPGGVGEIEVTGPSLMAGYLPEDANSDAFHEGWYRTGDVGWLEPEGWIHLTDRAKEMIKVKGFQVAPAELEAVLLGHPAVVDCAVFGIPDEDFGEVPIAAVQLQTGARVTVEDLMALVASSLASYKQLRDVRLVESVPRLPSGKVLRRQLRDEWAPVAAKPGAGD